MCCTKKIELFLKPGFSLFLTKGEKTKAKEEEEIVIIIIIKKTLVDPWTLLRPEGFPSIFYGQQEQIIY